MISLIRSTICAFLYGIVAAISLCGSVLVHAQVLQYPSKPVRVIVSTAAGSGADLVARIVIPKLGESFNRQFVIENRPGAGGNIAAEAVARAAPDGYTLLMGVAGLTINQALYAKLPYNLERDFDPIGLVGSAPLILVVHPSLPVTNIKALVAFAKARPGMILYGSSGNGSSPHLAAELFAMHAGVRLVHVPYKGSPQAVADLIAGQVSMMLAAPSTLMPHVNAGRLRALAICGPRRSALAPAVPTTAESGMAGFEVGTWNALFAPAGTPQEIISRLNAALSNSARSPEIRERLTAQGMDAVTGTPADLAAYVRSEIAKWTKVVKASGARVD